MAEGVFNLLDERWLPVRRLSGAGNGVTAGGSRVGLAEDPVHASIGGGGCSMRRLVEFQMTAARLQLSAQE